MLVIELICGAIPCNSQTVLEHWRHGPQDETRISIAQDPAQSSERIGIAHHVGQHSERMYIAHNVGQYSKRVSIYRDAAQNSTRMHIYRDRVYAPQRASYNSLDVYCPNSRGKHSVVMFIHGGSYMAGDKRSSVFYKPLAFTANGFIFVSIDYQLSPKVKYPTHVRNVAQALAWIYRNIGRYEGDPHRIYLLGHSAGAQLAALVATDEKFLGREGLPLSCLSGVILLDGGTYNLSATARSSRNYAMLLNAFGDDPKIWWQASALMHVHKNKNIPPFLIVCQSPKKNGWVQAHALNSALKRNRIDSTLVLAPDKNHATLNEDLGRPADRTTDNVFRFLFKEERRQKLIGQN